MSYTKAKTKTLPEVTPEQKKEQAVRFISQQRISMAQGIVYNMMSNAEIAKLNPKDIAVKAVAVADEMLACLFTPEANEEKKED